MKLELDHFFILIDPESKAGDLLQSLGMEESFSRDHDGQGTSNRRFVLSNSMLELLWVRDINETRNGPAKNLKFDERTNASPFGLIFTRTEGDSNEMPFDGWEYQPKYFEPPMAFHVGSNSENIQEPLCIYVPFVKPVRRIIEKGTLKSVSSVRVFVPLESLSETLLILTKAKGIQLECGGEHLMEITFDDNSGGYMRDLRPELPIVLYW